MIIRNTTAGYGTLARALHWLVAIGVFYLIYLGLQQSDMENGDAKTAIRATHASWALVVLVLMSVRIAWRLMNETPAYPDGMPGWQKAGATIVHWALYVAVFMQLLGGAMTVGTKGNGLPFFGMTLPVPIAENDAGHEFWEEIHEVSWILLAVLLVVHIFAALYNHFVKKNDVLRRMTVGVKD